ncbi:GntR family transcriptional regulator [Tannockella kyphosi]|uniref:GntR family transcriptional regulator n=1 Tax=Tannockella kyphosi TaxID=2899121 RepID=UPI002010D140|nr:GntR family transcriptional regulator [Tannockella kyphosi]
MDRPKYLQIKQSILEDIADKEPNTPIASEREISSLLGASRMTVRKAIEELCGDGVLYRDGNKGTFVADEKMHKNTKPIILDDVSDQSTFKILYFDIKSDGEEDVLKNLEMTHSEYFLRLVRLVKTQGKPICVEEIFVPRKNISDEQLGQLSKFLDLDHLIATVRTKQIFVPILVPTQYATLLKLKIGTPIIRIDNLLYEQNGEPHIFIKSYYNPTLKVIEIST